MAEHMQHQIMAFVEDGDDDNSRLDNMRVETLDTIHRVLQELNRNNYEEYSGNWMYINQLCRCLEFLDNCIILPDIIDRAYHRLMHGDEIFDGYELADIEVQNDMLHRKDEFIDHIMGLLTRRQEAIRASPELVRFWSVYRWNHIIPQLELLAKCI